MKDKILLYVYVGIGGMFGATSRFGLSIWLDMDMVFPWATLVTNWLGSFLLTFFLMNPICRQKISSHLFKALTVGGIGSFTTFSTVTYETIELAQTQIFLASLYIFMSVFGGLFCCYGAYLLIKNVGGRYD